MDAAKAQMSAPLQRNLSKIKGQGSEAQAYQEQDDSSAGDPWIMTAVDSTRASGCMVR
jgi:hypothetical protein